MPVPAHCEEALSRVLHSCRRIEHGLLPLEDPGSSVWQKVRCCCPLSPTGLAFCTCGSAMKSCAGVGYFKLCLPFYNIMTSTLCVWLS